MSGTRTMEPDRAKEVRSRRAEVMAKIDALLAEYPRTYGPIGMKKERA